MSKAVARWVGDVGSLFGCHLLSACGCSDVVPPPPPRSPLMSHHRLRPQALQFHTMVPRAPKGRGVHPHQRPPPAREPGPLPAVVWARAQAGAGSVLAPAGYCRSDRLVLARR